MSFIPPVRTRVHVVPEPEHKSEFDALDALQHETPSERRKALRAAGLGRAIIRMDQPEHVQADRAEAAIAASGLDVFQRGGDLVRPTATGGSVALRRVDHFGLLDLYSQVIDFQRPDQASGAYVSTVPPDRVARIHLSRGAFPRLPVLRGLITVPTIRPTGGIIAQPGYDHQTGLFLAPSGDFMLQPIPSSPTRADAAAALRTLDELLQGFPFVGPVDRSVAMAALLTTVARGAIATSPLFAIRANTPGTGKSYLVDVISILATGRPASVISAGSNDEETEKRLAGMLLSGAPLISIDNVNGSIGGDLLAQAVTQPIVSLRPLGGSTMVEIETRAVLLATGNGLQCRGDLVRRAVVCSLDAGVERPEYRSFASDPVDMATKDRGKFVAAALTVLQAHAIAKPSRPRPLGSFRQWSDTVRAALIWLGQADPVDSIELSRAEDPEVALLLELVQAWSDVTATGRHTVRALVDLAEARSFEAGGDFTWGNPMLRDVLLRIAGERGLISTRKLGGYLQAKQGRIVGGRKIVRAGTSHNAVMWTIETAQASPVESQD